MKILICDEQLSQRCALRLSISVFKNTLDNFECFQESSTELEGMSKAKMADVIFIKEGFPGYENILKSSKAWIISYYMPEKITSGDVTNIQENGYRKFRYELPFKNIPLQELFVGMQLTKEAQQ
jgi:hypothetical protein